MKTYNLAINLDGASDFLRSICQPVAEEFGLLLRDQVSHWRAANLVNVTNKAQKKLDDSDEIGTKRAHPRLIWPAIENASWIENDEVQEMWAGLLVSSCTPDGKDESNLIFINLLSQLTTSEANLLNFACEKASFDVDEMGLVMANPFRVTKDQLAKVCGFDDIYRIDREIDHLNALDLIEGWFGEDEVENEIAPWEADIAPTALGINLYVRCQGSSLPPFKYLHLRD